MILGTLCFSTLGCMCSFPMTRTFGVNDSFSGGPDPVPFMPALPQFITFLGNSGIASTKTFDDDTPNSHIVATLRHGLKGCFGEAIGQSRTLTLCFSARAHSDDPSDDSVTIHDTDSPSFTFPVVFSGPIVPTLSPTWKSADTGMLCIDLTPQMQANQVGNMLQVRLGDDTEVDFITMTLQ
jgi:hypothetical protein